MSNAPAVTSLVGVDEYDSTCVAHWADIIRRHV
jgi:hypothetical protein